MKTRKDKLTHANKLLHDTGGLNTQDADFMHKHGYKQQVYMFVYTPEDKLKAENILQTVNDSTTTVTHCGKDETKL